MGNFLSVGAMKASDALGCIGSAVILLLASAWIPFVGPFFSLLTPLPFLYYTSKSGLYQGVKVAVVTILVIGLIANLAGFPQLIFLCLEFSVLGMVIAEIYRRGFSVGYAVFLATALMLFVGVVMLAVISASKNMGPMALILDYFQNNLREALQIYENTGPEQEKALQLEEYVRALTGIIAKVYPALVIIGTGFVVWINVVISKPLFRVTKLKYPDFGPLDRWQAPEFMVWGVIAAGFSLFLTIRGIKLAAINALIVMLVIYVFHGLSIILFFFNKYRVPPWIRFGAYFLIVFQQIVLVGLAMAGLFDQWVDFRKIHPRRETE